MCMCVAAIRVIVTRYTAQNVMQTCMLPRELIWEKVADTVRGMMSRLLGNAMSALVLV